jgi:hypothetical protein
MLRSTLVLCCTSGWLLVACSNSSDAACGTLSATYSNTETVTTAGTGDCTAPPAESGTVVITGAGPNHEVTLPNIQGPCPAISDSCGLNVQCNVDITDTNGNPSSTAKLTADWTFTTAGFSGTSTLVTQKSDGTTCTTTFTDIATRQ